MSEQQPANLTSAERPQRGPVRWGPVLGVAAFAAAALVVCGLLGSWQWTRANHQDGVVYEPQIVPIADLTIPGETASGIGASTSVTGTWGEGPSAIVTGREVEGQAAHLLIVPLVVDAHLTGIDAPATLAVVAGWLPADAMGEVPVAGATAAAVGYLRGTESAGSAPVERADGTVELEGMSTAALSQLWPSPVYSAILVADSPAPGWNALPQPEPEHRLNFRSVTYAVEWWVFGAFAVFLAVRWIRDNGRSRVDEPVDPAATPEE